MNWFFLFTQKTTPKQAIICFGRNFIQKWQQWLQFQINTLMSAGVSVVAMYIMFWLQHHSEPLWECSVRFCSSGGELTNEKLSESLSVDPFHCSLEQAAAFANERSGKRQNAHPSALCLTQPLTLYIITHMRWAAAETPYMPAFQTCKLHTRIR
jgi:hypothetical protein